MTAEASLRPQRASALAFLQKKATAASALSVDVRTLARHGWSQFSAAVSCYAQLCVRMLQPRATSCKRCER